MTTQLFTVADSNHELARTIRQLNSGNYSLNELGAVCNPSVQMSVNVEIESYIRKTSGDAWQPAKDFLRSLDPAKRNKKLTHIQRDVYKVKVLISPKENGSDCLGTLSVWFDQKHKCLADGMVAKLEPDYDSTTQGVHFEIPNWADRNDPTFQGNLLGSIVEVSKHHESTRQDLVKKLEKMA